MLSLASSYSDAATQTYGVENKTEQTTCFYEVLVIIRGITPVIHTDSVIWSSLYFVNFSITALI